MKRKWFHPGLFRESLRQLRVVSLTSFVILEVITVLTAVGYLVSALEETAGLNGGTATAPEGLYLSLANPALFAVPFLVAPLMAFYLFRHMNQRSGSDFYHALPCRREALFISQILALVVSVAGILLAMTLTSTMLFLPMSRWYLLNFSSVWITAFNLFATAMLVVGGIALGMSVTGTLFSNVIVSLLILYLPRVFLAFVSFFISWSFSPVDPMHLMGILDPPYNLLTSVIINLFFGETPGITSYLPGGVYTLSLGVLYTVGAGILFCRRNSEIAGKAAASRPLQAAFRLAVSMVVSLFPCGMILVVTVNREDWDFLKLFWVVVLYVGVLIAYFLYELITTKHFRNLLKAVPALGILLLLNVLLIAGSLGGRQILINREIEAKSVRSVRLISGENEARNFEWKSNYFTLKGEQVSFDNEQLITLLTNRYRGWVEEVYRENVKYAGFSDGQEQLVCFEMKDGTHIYRKVPLNIQNQEKLVSLVQQNDDFRRAYLELPAPGENGTTCTVSNLTEQQSRRLYEVMRREVAKQPFIDWYNTVSELSDEDTLPAAMLAVTANVGSRVGTFQISLPLYLKETCQTYLSLYQESHPHELSDLIRCFEQIRDSQKEGTYRGSAFLTVAWTGKDGNYSSGFSLNTYDSETDYDEKTVDLEKIGAFLNGLKGKEATAVGPLYYLELEIFKFRDPENRGPQTYCAYAVMTGGEPDPFLLKQTDAIQTEEITVEADGSLFDEPIQAATAM